VVATARVLVKGNVAKPVLFHIRESFILRIENAILTKSVSLVTHIVYMTLSPSM